jgi:hypothetical protein
VPAKSALRIVQQDVGFEHTRLRDAEVELTKLLAHRRQFAAQAQLDFDFEPQGITLRQHQVRCQMQDRSMRRTESYKSMTVLRRAFAPPTTI